MICYTRRVLHGILADAVKLGYISVNPAHYADVPVAADAQDKMQIFSGAERQQFIEACPDVFYGGMYLHAIKTGMRRGELLGLTWKNVDVERGEIRIIQQLSRFGQDGQRLVFAPLKTRYSRRTLKVGAGMDEVQSKTPSSLADKAGRGLEKQLHRFARRSILEGS